MSPREVQVWFQNRRSRAKRTTAENSKVFDDAKYSSSFNTPDDDDLSKLPKYRLIAPKPCHNNHIKQSGGSQENSTSQKFRKIAPKRIWEVESTENSGSSDTPIDSEEIVL